ncbi:hypothetical protein [Actinophytocola gossypii]|uniref:Diguanylate cyclase n=1 Tax=Actinophytocola gossypii TaxID=2812003 RepID=A0ABT2JG90_9PSEU|nr:hypothetical protein [Actinophytocola gossypii]MCT2586875.1 diguanylate cyclase [Actinophytocola gossypii]
MAAWDELPAAGGLGECAALVRSAEALRFSAPELAVQLARRALSLGAVGPVPGAAGSMSDAAGATSGAAGSMSGATGRAGASATDHAVGQDTGESVRLSMRAHAVLAAGLVRLSHYVDAVEPAFVALSLAESGGATELAASVRLDLAACAREVGEPLLGCAVLRPVLEAAWLEPSVRAIALGRLVGCTAHVGRRDDVEDALAEAERLLATDDALSQDASRMERARLLVRGAAYHRWYGDTEDAVEAAREGLGQLNRLHGRRPETDRLRAQLVLELVCALLDEGEPGEAEAASVALLADPVRATSAAAVGQLMLAVSTRVHLPSGRVERGRGLLDQAVWVADRYGLDGLLVDALAAVSDLDERAGRTSDALEALRTARAAEQRRLRATARAARQILAVVGAAEDWDAAAATALLRATATSLARPQLSSVRAMPQPAAPEPKTETDTATGLLNQEGLFRRLRAVRNGERPVALTLVRLGETGTRTNFDLAALAGRVRDLAPDDAELARSDGSELAVLLPHTTRDQAEEFAETVRKTALESNWLPQANARSISTGVGQSNPDAPAVDANALLTAARHALEPVDELESPRRRPGERTQPVHATAMTAEALSELEDVGDTLRIGRSIISSLSIPAGSGGKRRAPTGTHPTAPPDHTAHPDPAPDRTPDAPAARAPAAHRAPDQNSAAPGAGEHAVDQVPGSSGKRSGAHHAAGRSGAGTSAAEGLAANQPGAHRAAGWSTADTSAEGLAANHMSGSTGDAGGPRSGSGWDVGQGAEEAAANRLTAHQSTGAATVEGHVAQRTGESTAAWSGSHQAPRGDGAERTGAGAAAGGPADAAGGTAPSPTEQQGSTSARHAAPVARPDSLPGAPPAAAHSSAIGETSASSATGENPALSVTGEHSVLSAIGENSASSVTGENLASSAGEATTEPRAVGETGGYRPLISFDTEPEQERAEPGGTSASSGYRSSYEETRAELARLMSVLESGSVPDIPAQTAGGGAAEAASDTGDNRDTGDTGGNRGISDNRDTGEDAGSPWAGGRWSFSPVGEGASAGSDDELGTPRTEADEVPAPRRHGSPGDRPEAVGLAGDRPEVVGLAGDHTGAVTSGGTGGRDIGAGENAGDAPGRRERRAERSAGSSTISGLFAEALAAYQEPGDEPAPAGGDAEGSSFDRLFDWRYQSPESGRHRSPE